MNKINFFKLFFIISISFFITACDSLFDKTELNIGYYNGKMNNYTVTLSKSSIEKLGYKDFLSDSKNIYSFENFLQNIVSERYNIPYFYERGFVFYSTHSDDFYVFLDIMKQPEFLKDNKNLPSSILDLPYNIEEIIEKEIAYLISDETHDIDSKISQLNNLSDYLKHNSNSYFYNVVEKTLNNKEFNVDNSLSQWNKQLEKRKNSELVKNLVFNYKIENYEIVKKDNRCFIKYPDDIKVSFNKLNSIEYNFKEYDISIIDCNSSNSSVAMLFR